MRPWLARSPCRSRPARGRGRACSTWKAPNLGRLSPAVPWSRTLSIDSWHRCTSEEEYPYHHASAAEALCTYREELGHKLQPHSGGLVFDDDGAVWWTFAGGHINATLRHALRTIGCDWTMIPDNFSLRFRGEGVSPAAVMAAQRRIREPEVWQELAAPRMNLPDKLDARMA